ncbi:guanylate kinase [Lacrimispora sp. NSJ-141]|uniref:Guanylate kinase n=1 Tax=Lientehia hominis TaxID=2897778 RepID=A0AAP2RKN2_9FIRM|nr:guanylate kinase [Lientehia hominis]
MSKEGLILVVSGFSGVGKGTVVKHLLEKYDNYALSVSATTRAPREGETNGKEYFFMNEDEFSAMADSGQLIEYAGYVGHHYGTPREYVKRRLEAGVDIILEIEIQGALNVKRQYPDAVLVFVIPPDAATLKRRLVGRGTETLPVIEERLKRAVEESEGMEQYDYLLVNDDLETCVEELHQIMRCEHRKAGLNQELIDCIRDDLKRFVKGER